jgi:tetratricopeptide (TPR) repeat protein
MWFLYAIGTAYALSVTLVYVFARYRFPIALLPMLLASAGLRVPAVVAALAILLSRIPLEDSHRFCATHYLSIAIELSKDPAQAGMAMDFYKRALDAGPEFPSAELRLGVLLARAGREDEAIYRYRKALAAWPEYVEARYDLGRALAATGSL